MDFLSLCSLLRKTAFYIIALPLLIQGCSTDPKQKPTQFVAARFNDLQGWNADQALGLREALLESCKVYTKRTGLVSKKRPLYGTYEQWKTICADLPRLTTNDLISFFENRFSVYQIDPEKSGLFTGYFTPLLRGSRTQSQRYNVPLLKVPNDLVQFDPADFGLKNPQNQSFVGKVENHKFIPYDDRASINQRTNKGDYDDDVLIWLDDRVARFFLQIQGSGTVRLDTGEDIQVRFDGRNGHKYYAIGRYLKNNNLLEKVSMQSIREWLEENPNRMDEVLHTNPSYIFFSELTKAGPLGAQNTRLIAEHSVAIDTRYIPLGTPLWVSTTRSYDNTPFQQAVVAQDVGSAIRGSVRADIFFGAGDKAGEIAGYQNAEGKLYIMTPKQ